METGDQGLYTKKDLVPQPRAIILMTHGLGEHSRRYDKWVFDLNQDRISTFRFDLPGHGRSRTGTWLFKDFNKLTTALGSQYMDARKYAENHNIPLFLFGHSMGGLVTADFVIRSSPDVAGVILSAPLLDPGEVVRTWMIQAAGWLKEIAPGLPIMQVPPDQLSRDKDVVAQYKNDPLVHHGRIRVNTGYELLSRMKEVNDSVEKFNAPVLMLQGQADKIVRPEVSESFFNQLKLEDKTWHSYADMYHEILNDIGNDRVKTDIVEWLSNRIS